MALGARVARCVLHRRIVLLRDVSEALIMWDDINLEVAIIERQAFEAVREKIASQQLGLAWVDLEYGDDDAPSP